MVNRVVVKNFKKFESLDFQIKDRLVIAGPNNSGKTTLLQAVATWSEIASIWRRYNSDRSRENDGNYPSTNLGLLGFYSVPLADFDHLWKDKSVELPASIWLHTSRWKIGFEILYKEPELAAIRPARGTSETDLDKYVNEPLEAIYIPPFSGLDIREPFFNPVVIPARLARAQSGSVLRNLLLDVSRDEEKWLKLQEIIGDFFGYELISPSGDAEIFAGYRHSKKDKYYDLSSGASGFLQVLMVYAVLLSRGASVVLIDEPDAHLHILLQDKMYRDLVKHARENKSQLIFCTHSESLIKAVAPHHLYVVQADRLKGVTDNVKRDALITILKFVSNEEIVLAQETENPGILYVEGRTDISILREWARVLDHRLHSFLEKPFWKPAVYDIRDQGEGIEAKDHFEALKLVRGDIEGVELHDGDGKSREPRTLENGLVRIFWKRYEIESYLVHPAAIARFAESVGGETAADKAREYMKNTFPQDILKTPLEDESSIFLMGTKAKDVLSTILSKAGIYEASDYSQIAALMKEEEIHPEVVEKLDRIADCLGIEKE